VESVLISILSLLDDAECSSPANVDAGVQLRKDPAGYRERVREDVERSKKDIPEGFIMPTFESTVSKPVSEKDDADFWADSDVDVYSDGDDDPFGGSDSSDFGGDDDDMELDDEGDSASDDEAEKEEDKEA
jgi:ubiquitin-conjugating enzyme E2 R